MLAALVVGTADAQQVDVSELDACSREPSEELRLRCFEALAARHRRQPADEAAERSPTETDDARPDGADRAVTAPEEGPGLDDDAGRDHLPSERPQAAADVGPMIATVTHVTRRADRLLYFHMDNGQVWRQMERGYIRYPREGEFEVEIRRGVMGDYQLRVDPQSRMTRIVRVR